MSPVDPMIQSASPSRGSDALTALMGILAVWACGAFFVFATNEYVSLIFFAIVVAMVVLVRRLRPALFVSVKSSMAARIDIVAAVSLVLFILLPLLLKSNPYWIHVFTIVFVFGIVVQGLNIHLGEIGAINVGYAAFFAIGAYCTAILSADYGLNFWLAVVVATVMCWLAGLLVGLCTMKTTGDYLALVTLAFGLVIYQLAVNMSWLTHGTNGMHVPKPSLFGHHFGEELSVWFFTVPREANFYYTALFFLIVAMLVSKRVTASWMGRTWAAMRQDRVGAACFGINVPVLQIFSFAFGAAFGGISGGIYAAEIGFIEPRELMMFFSITAICMVILGGMGNWWGAVVAALIMIVIPEKLRAFQELRYFLYGVVLLGILLYRPLGIFPSPRRKHEQTLS